MISIPMIIHESTNSNPSNSNKSQDTPRLKVCEHAYTSNRSSQKVSDKKNMSIHQRIYLKGDAISDEQNRFNETGTCFLRESNPPAEELIWRTNNGPPMSLGQ